MLGFLSLPVRSSKPRDIGITCVLDRGMGVRQLEDLFDAASDYIDILKFGWGTAYVTQNVFDKIRVCHEANVAVCFGGTFLELAILQGRFDEYRNVTRKAGLTHVEISNGVIDMSRQEKARYIRELGKDFVVLSEVGSKDAQRIIPRCHWVEQIESDLDAGAWKVVCEGRESGTVGLYFGTGEVRSGLLQEITDTVNPMDLILEAPLRIQQAWMVKTIGTEVSVANIAPADVITLETIRCGLHPETMPFFHGVEQYNAKSGK